MIDPLSHLAAALAGRYTIERGIGAERFRRFNLQRSSIP